MFIYIIVRLAAYILSILLHLLYILFFAYTFFLGVSGDTTAPMLALPLREQRRKEKGSQEV